MWIRKKKTHLIAQVFLVLILFIAILSLLGSIIRKDYLQAGLPAYYRTAFNAGLIFLVLCVGIYGSSPMHYIRFSYKQKITGYFSIFLLIVVILFFISNLNNKRTAETAKLIEHTSRVLVLSQKLLSEAQDIETGRRGFVITGDEKFLEPYHRGSAAIRILAKNLADSVHDIPAQHNRIDSLQKLIQEKISFAENMIRLKRSGALNAGEQISFEGKGKEIMDKIRSVVSGIQQEESRLLAERKTESVNNIGNSNRFTILLQVLLAIMLISVLFLINNNNRLRTRAEKSLQKSHTQLQQTLDGVQQLMNTSYDVICTIDGEGRFVQVSEGSKRLWGYEPEELSGKSYLGMVVEADRERSLQAATDLRTTVSLAAFENHYYRKDGSVIPVMWTAAWSDADQMIYAIARDGSEKKLTAEELARLNESLEKKAAELQASNTELERFAYVASHDLQEPLRMVSSFLELLEKKLEGQLDDKGKQYIHFAVDGADRMKKLIQDLLQYSRVGTSTEGKSQVDCNDILRQVRAIFELSLQEKRASLTVHPLPSINGFRGQILQLFQNLVGNALKYNSNPQPFVEVGCTDKGSTWEFYVKDNGIGIDPKFFDKIFIIFQRLHNKTEYSGTGIGLAICKKIVERHGGRIWVESTPGQGSKFYISLPK